MGIQCVNATLGIGDPQTVYLPMSNSMQGLPGDVFGLTTGGLALRLDDEGGQVITSGGGIYGIAQDSYASNSAGGVTTPAGPSGVASNVPANLAIGSYGQRVPPAAPIAGVARGQVRAFGVGAGNYFIQRHKQGTRVNDSLCGKKCDLVYNDTTNEWEVDTTATSVNDIVIAPANFQMPGWYDNGPNFANHGLWDSASYATDTYGAWIVFTVVPAFNAEANGLRY